MSTHFIGFDTLESFTASLLPLSKTGAVYFMLTRLTHPETVLNNGRYTYRLVASQIQGHLVHYWMTDVAVANFIGSDILSEHEDRPNTANSALQAVADFFKARGIRTIGAQVAMPADFRLLEGNFGTAIQYDRETRRYSLRPTP